MPNVAAGTIWNLPNYAGLLFTASPLRTPFLSMIGGLSGGGLQTENFEFPTDSEYAHNAASQPSITETASLTAPTAISYVRTQNKNVTQIFQEQVSISYVKMSNQGRMSSINTAGANNPVVSEKDWQIAKAMEKIARDAEYSFINGVYQIATNAAVANQTRGILAAAVVGGSTVAAGAATLTKAMIDSVLLAMAGAGALFKNIVLFCNGFQKQQVSNVYGFAPMDRNIGGLNVKQIETDFCQVAVQYDPFMPTDTIVFVDVALCAPVFQPVPGKGNFFYEALSKSGAAEAGQVFGQLGLAYGPAWAHGSITGLATS